MRFPQNLYSARGVASALLISTLLLCPSRSQAQFDEAGAQQLVDLLNQERANQGLPPLAVDQNLTFAARKHTELMAAHKTVSHRFDQEPAMQFRFADEDLHSDRQAENLAFTRDVFSAHRGFMHSPPHRASILSASYNVVGVAVLQSGDYIYVTEDFAHRLTEYSEHEADAVLQRAIETYVKTHGMLAPARKPQPQLRHMACEMALTDSVKNQKAADLPGVHEIAAWTTTAPTELPGSVREVLSRPMSSGYSLGACFAPSVSRPGGTYWVVMVVY